MRYLGVQCCTVIPVYVLFISNNPNFLNCTRSAEDPGLTSMNGFWKDDVDISWKSNLSEGAFLLDQDFVYINTHIYYRYELVIIHDYITCILHDCLLDICIFYRFLCLYSWYIYTCVYIYICVNLFDFTFTSLVCIHFSSFMVFEVSEHIFFIHPAFPKVWLLWFKTFCLSILIIIQKI